MGLGEGVRSSAGLMHTHTHTRPADSSPLLAGEHTDVYLKTLVRGWRRSLCSSRCQNRVAVWNKNFNRTYTSQDVGLLWSEGLDGGTTTRKSHADEDSSSIADRTLITGASRRGGVTWSSRRRWRLFLEKMRSFGPVQTASPPGTGTGTG